MPPIFWLALALGYVVGVSAAVLLLPRQIIEPLHGLLAAITAVVVLIGGGAVALLRPWRRPRIRQVGPPDPDPPQGVRQRRPPWAADSGEAAIEPRFEAPVAQATEVEPGEPRGLWPWGVPPAVTLLPAVDESDLGAALRQGQVRIVIRPLTAWPSTPVVYHQASALLCDQDGGPSSPRGQRASLARAGLTGRLDHMLLAHAREVLDRAHGSEREIRLVCAIDPGSLAEPGPLAELESLMGERPELASRLILMVERLALARRPRAVLDRARAQGVGLCVERLGTGPIDTAALARGGFDHVRLAAGPVRFDQVDPRQRDLVERLAEQGATTLVDGPGEAAVVALGAVSWIDPEPRLDAA